MSFDFPNSPTNGDKYQPAGGPTYVYSNGVWLQVAGSPALAEPYPFATSDTQLKSYAAVADHIALNSKVDGTGYDILALGGTTTGGGAGNVLFMGLATNVVHFGMGMRFDVAATGWKATAVGYPAVYTQSVVDGTHRWYSDTASRAVGDVAVPSQLMTLSRAGLLTFGAANVTGNATVGSFNTSGNWVVQMNGNAIYQPSGGPLMIQQNGGVNASAFLTYHISGSFAANMGWHGDGGFRMGGWSYGNAWWQVWTAKDFAAPACDYRIKENVEPLPSMWDRVKALKPISYTVKEFSLPEDLKRQRYRDGYRAHFKEEPPVVDNPLPMPPDVKADPTPRWGLIAHEVQEALIESAANGVKDDPDLIQSPTPIPIIAALTKALQEAMARIEALEARP